MKCKIKTSEFLFNIPEEDVLAEVDYYRKEYSSLYDDESKYPPYSMDLLSSDVLTDEELFSITGTSEGCELEGVLWSHVNNIISEDGSFESSNYHWQTSRNFNDDFKFNPFPLEPGMV